MFSLLEFNSPSHTVERLGHHRTYTSAPPVYPGLYNIDALSPTSYTGEYDTALIDDSVDNKTVDIANKMGTLRHVDIANKMGTPRRVDMVADDNTSLPNNENIQRGNTQETTQATRPYRVIKHTKRRAYCRKCGSSSHIRSGKKVCPKHPLYGKRVKKI